MTAREFADRLARSLRHFDALTAKDPDQVQRTKIAITRDFVLESLILNFAQKNNIDVTSAETDLEVDRIRSGFPNDITFRQSLAEEGLSFSDWKKQVRHRLIQQKCFQKITAGLVVPSQQEIQKFYDENKEKYRRKESVYIRQILLDEETKAIGLLEELSKKDFADMAKKYSIAPEAKQGGVIGWIEKGNLELFDKAFTLPIGKPSAVIKSPYGFHILKVEKKAPSRIAAFEEVEQEIGQMILGQREQAQFARWLDSESRSAQFLRNGQIIDAMKIETQGEANP